MRLLLHNIQYGTGRLRRFSWIEIFSRTIRHFPNITRFVELTEPDLIGLVEVDSGSYRMKKKNQAYEIGSALHYEVYSRVKYPDLGLGRKMPVLEKQSNAVLSRQPVRQCIFHDFTTGFKSLAIEARLPQFTFFLVHLALGIKARHRQLLELHDLIMSAPRPLLLAGDFNTLSGSWEMDMFLKAAGLVSANQAHRPSYPSWHAKKELDFICHDKSIRPIRFRMPHVCLSDHLPLLFDFELENEVKTASQ